MVMSNVIKGREVQSERCESCGTWLWIQDTPGIDGERYQLEMTIQPRNSSPPHTPKRCQAAVDRGVW
jgi:hypothetical protein